VRVVFDLSASSNLIAPSLPIVLSVLSENQMNQQVLLLLRLREVRDEFDLSASDNSIAPSVSILLPVLSEYGMNNKSVTAEIEKMDDKFITAERD
jgi:hypothetical protein